MAMLLSFKKRDSREQAQYGVHNHAAACIVLQMHNIVSPVTTETHLTAYLAFLLLRQYLCHLLKYVARAAVQRCWMSASTANPVYHIKNVTDRLSSFLKDTRDDLSFFLQYISILPLTY